MAFTLTLTSQPEVPLEAEAITPERLEGLFGCAFVHHPSAGGRISLPRHA